MAFPGQERREHMQQVWLTSIRKLASSSGPAFWSRNRFTATSCNVHRKRTNENKEKCQISIVTVCHFTATDACLSLTVAKSNDIVALSDVTAEPQPQMQLGQVSPDRSILPGRPHQMILHSRQCQGLCHFTALSKIVSSYRREHTQDDGKPGSLTSRRQHW